MKVLDYGLVQLVDSMGNDERIVDAARTSYGQGTTQKRDTKGLLRYLVRNMHVSPLEFVTFTFYVKAPIFVTRQLFRHRTGQFSTLNEYSQRYSEVLDQFYVPESFKGQDTKNKQGSSGALDGSTQFVCNNILTESYKKAYEDYQALLKYGVSREIARIVLPLATYTQFYWKIDLNNLFHFLSLRLDAHAQYEIRVYAEAIAKIVKEVVPLAYEAFEEYHLHSVTLSRGEAAIVAENLDGCYYGEREFDFFGDQPSEKVLTDRKSEFSKKVELPHD